MLAKAYPWAHFMLYDTVPGRLAALVAQQGSSGVRCVAAEDAHSAVRGADVVVTSTVTTTGYLQYSWLQPGALIAHVSLDDVTPDVVRRADLVVVDDWELVSSDERRLLGRMFRLGDLVGPGGQAYGRIAAEAAPVSASLADVLAGRHPGRESPDQIVLSNPFGMGILDVALAAEVWHTAERLGIGVSLPV